MTRGFVIASIAAVTLLVPLRVAAHHGAAAFDTGKRVVLKAPSRSGCIPIRTAC